MRTGPEQSARSQSSSADELDTDDGPRTGLPVFGSTWTKSLALLADEVVRAVPPPFLTEKSAVSPVPRQCFDTEVSSAAVELSALPPHLLLSEQFTSASALDTATGPEARFSIVVSLFASQEPPAPYAEHFESPLLARTPLTSPDAEPFVELAA